MLMINAEISSPTMELVPLLCLCLLIGFGSTSAAENSSDLKDRTEENIPGAASRPYFRILNQTNEQALLQCEVVGAYPKPTLQFTDSSQRIVKALKDPEFSETGGAFKVVVQTIVNKKGNYSCVVTQQNISHKINASTFVYFHGATNSGVVVPCVFGPVVFLALLETIG